MTKKKLMQKSEIVAESELTETEIVAELELSENNSDLIEEFIDNCERTKKAFFWNPPTYAMGRRSYESKNTFDLDIAFEIFQYKRQKSIKFIVKLKANLHLTCSCKNVYRYCTIEINNHIVNLTVLKHLNEIKKGNKNLSSRFILKYLL
jgi:hypothetical protein